MFRINISLKNLAIVFILFFSIFSGALAWHYSNAWYVFAQKFGPKDPTTVFTRIYKNNSWIHGSGPGSDPKHAKEYVTLLQKYFNDPRFKTFVDLGCGDWQFMSFISIPNNKVYKGYEVVPSLVNTVRQRFAKANVQFHTIHDLQDFNEQQVTGDLLIVKDVMQHLPNSEVSYFLHYILPKFKYALITNDIIESYPPINYDIEIGGFRALDLTTSPFNIKNTEVVLDYLGPSHKQVLLYTNPKFLT